MTPAVRQILMGAPRLRLLPPYMGQVATQYPSMATNRFTTFKQAMSRAHCFARDNISNPVCTFPAFFCSATLELGAGADITITASIEYPAGTFTQITFSSSATGTITNGSYLRADPCPVSIPNGASFWVRSYITCSSAIIWSAYTDTQNGEAGNLNSSGVTDQTLGGTVTNNNAPYRPMTVEAMTRKPSILLLGDSKQGGFKDTVSDSSGDRGEIARSIGPVLAYVNMGVNSERAVDFATQSANRALIGQCCTHVIGQHGINDIVNVSNRTAAQCEASHSTIAGLFPDKPYFPCTIVPDTSSTDSWATAGNQTTKTNESERQTYNTNMRTTAASFRRWGIIDLASVIEDPTNLGKWITNGAANFVTDDGLHEDNAGCLYLKNSGIVKPYRIANSRY